MVTWNTDLINILLSHSQIACGHLLNKPCPHFKIRALTFYRQFVSDKTGFYHRILLVKSVYSAVTDMFMHDVRSQ